MELKAFPIHAPVVKIILVFAMLGLTELRELTYDFTLCVFHMPLNHEDFLTSAKSIPNPILVFLSYVVMYHFHIARNSFQFFTTVNKTGMDILVYR